MTCISDAPADSSPEVLAVAPGLDLSSTLPEYGRCLVGYIITLDDASFTVKIAVQCGANALAPYDGMAFLDTGCSQTFIRRDVLDSMFSVGAHRSRANGNALLDPGVMFANLPLYQLRRASA